MHRRRLQVEGILFNSAAAARTLGLPGVHCAEALGSKKGAFVPCFFALWFSGSEEAFARIR